MFIILYNVSLKFKNNRYIFYFKKINKYSKLLAYMIYKMVGG